MTILINRSKKWISLALTAILLLSLVLPLNVSAALEQVSLAKGDFSKGNLVATSGTAANLDETLSVNGGPVIATAYVAGATTGNNVPNASPWTANPAFGKVSISKGYQNITLSSMQRSSGTGRIYNGLIKTVASSLNKKYKPAIDEKKATVVGTAAVDLVGGNPAARTGETNLGNFVADGMLAKAKTINPNTLIALQNGGGVRTTLPAGNITLADVFKVLPFGNALGIMDLKGEEIKAALEYSVKDAPAAFGGFLQVSGLKFSYDPSKPVGGKVQTIEVKGQDGTYTALDLTKNYSVATNIFTAKGGDGYTVFAKAYAEGRVSEPGFVDWEMFRDFIAAQPNKTVTAQVEGRIVNLAPQVVPAASFSGTEASPKVYTGNVIVDVTGVTKLEYATVKGNLILKGGTDVELSTVTVEGDTIFED